MNSSIKKARPSQAQYLSDLALRSKAYWGYSAGFMAMCRAELTYTAEEIQNGLCYLLEQDHQAAGFYILLPIDTAVCEMDGLFVEPGFMGKGYGRRLFRHAGRIAKTHGFEKIIIQADPNSVEFYVAAGCVRTGTMPSLSIAGRVLPMLEFLT